MNDRISFKEPERCKYIYIDEHNKVHLLLPIVGGDEIGLDNTCQTAEELKSFFFGETDPLKNYKKQLEEDIEAINSQTPISRDAYKDLLREKKERLIQIEHYIELMRKVKKQSQVQDIDRDCFPALPSGLENIIKSSQNAFSVRLSPERPDPYTRFNDPLFSIKRSQEGSRTGLGYRLRSLFTPLEIQRGKSPKEEVKEIVARVSAQIGSEKMNEEQFKKLKELIRKEFDPIFPGFVVDYDKLEGSGKEITWEYLAIPLGLDEDVPAKEWAEAIITLTVDYDHWPKLKDSVFYEIPKIKDTGREMTRPEEIADFMSIKVQYFLGEINLYCKKNQLSKTNFGKFFDKEPHATNIAQLVKNGLANGEDIEPLIYNYINEHTTKLGLKSPLTEKQQQEITDKFSQHFNTIKASPHFDEFFIVDPDKKGTIFSHQGTLCCHFLDFFAKQTKGKYPLGDFDGYSKSLQKETSNRLNHKNEIVAKGYNKLEEFKNEVVRLLAENKPKELVNYLITPPPPDVPNYSMLSLETQNYISYSGNWPEIDHELQSLKDDSPMKQELIRLLSPENVDRENLSAITWSKYSAKPLVEEELKQIAEGLTLTVDIYNEKRDKQWYKGSRNKDRERQCDELKKIAEEINVLLENQSLSKSQILEKVLKSIETLERIDNEISQTSNRFQSTLQKEIRVFQNKLKDICELDNFAFKSTKLEEIISLEMEEQYEKIQNPAVKEIVKNLPSHNQTKETIEFFNTLTEEQANKVASYFSLEYREFDSSKPKFSLLNDDIPALFKQVNTQILSKFKEEGFIGEAEYKVMSRIAGSFCPQDLIQHAKENKWLTSQDSHQKEISKIGKFNSFKKDLQEILKEKIPENENDNKNEQDMRIR